MSTDVTERARSSLPPEKLAYSVDEVSLASGISKRKVYELIESGRLPSRKLDRRRLILYEDLTVFLRNLPDDAQVEEEDE